MRAWTPEETHHQPDDPDIMKTDTPDRQVRRSVPARLVIHQDSPGMEETRPPWHIWTTEQRLRRWKMEKKPAPMIPIKVLLFLSGVISRYPLRILIGVLGALIG